MKTRDMALEPIVDRTEAGDMASPPIVDKMKTGDMALPRTIDKMNAKISMLKQSNMRDEEAFAFYTIADGEFKKCDDPMFAPVYETFSACLQAFDRALESPRGSLLTARIAEANRRRRRAYGGIAWLVRVSLHHVDPAKADAALRLNAILRAYKNPRVLEYVECTGVILNIVEDLSATGARAWLASLGATEWFDELKSANEEFDALFLERVGETRPVSGIVRRTRAAVALAYAACVTRLNALVEINLPGVFAPVVGPVNVLTEQRKNAFRARQGRKKSRDAREVVGCGVDPVALSSPTVSRDDVPVTLPVPEGVRKGTSSISSPPVLSGEIPAGATPPEGSGAGGSALPPPSGGLARLLRTIRPSRGGRGKSR
jgi:hypothetical protein